MRLALLPLAAALLLSRAAHADVGDWEAGYNPGRAQRRSDFAMGVTMGAMVGSVSGYPNDANKINVDQYRASTGAAAGPETGLWLGGALRDWFVVGVGMSFGSVAGGDATLSRGGAFVLHLEGFPLFSLGGPFRDLALVGEVGTGSRNLFKGSASTADGGVTSYIAAGVLYEPIRIGKHISAGPTLQLARQFSETLSGTFAIAAFQIAYYGGPD